jgi:tyrosine-protein kinase Etk/Wzc
MGKTLRQNARLVLGVATAVILLTAVITFLITPVYESEAAIRISSGKPESGLLGELPSLPGLSLGGLGQDELDTEMGVLRSRQLADQVADSLALNVRLLEPRIPRSQVFSEARGGENAPEGEYVLRRRSDGRYTVEAENVRRPVSLPESVSAGETFQLGTLAISLAPALAADPPRKIRFEVAPFRATVKKMREELMVDRQSGRSRLVEVSYRSTDPRLAAAVTNGITGSFIAYKERTGTAESRGTAEVLREQIAMYGGQLRGAEEALRTFREREQIVSPEEQATQQVRRAAELQAIRDAHIVERRALAALLAQVQQNRPREGEPSPYRQLVTFPSFISNRAIQDILQSLTELETQRSERLLLRTPEDAEVRQYDRRIGELESQLFRLSGGYLESLDNQIAAANTVLDGFGEEMGRVPAQEVAFARLARDQAVLNEVYLFLQKRLKEAEIQEAVEPGDARVIDYGLVPEKPVSPRPVVNLVLGTVLGLVLGVTAAMGREMLDNKVRTAVDAERASGGTPVLASVPRIQSLGGAEGGSSRRFGRRITPPSRQARLGEHLVTRHERWTPAAEAYRTLRTNITLGSAGSRPRLLVFTSPSGDEGKSISAANLAITFAQQGIRTLLVDADLRRGVLHREFGVREEPGLVHLLVGGSTLEAAVQELPGGHAGVPLHFIATGALPPNPAELLGSERMARLLSEMRERYDAVVFDSPPLDLATDAVVLGSAADAVLLVARSGTTEQGALEAAVMQLRRLPAPLSGIVLNDVREDGRESYHRLGAESNGRG